MRSIRPTSTGARVLLCAAAGAAGGTLAAGAAGLLGRSGPDEAWRRTSAGAFPAAAAEALAGGMDGEAVQRLAADLDGEHRTATRAAVLLGAALADPSIDAGVRDEAALALRARLESRRSGGQRHEIAADVVAARALDARAIEPAPLAASMASLPDQAMRPRTWERVTTLAWAKTRAADALARAGGLEMQFRPDGSWAHQMEEAERLEAALR